DSNALLQWVGVLLMSFGSPPRRTPGGGARSGPAPLLGGTISAVQLMLHLQNLCGTLANDDTGRHGVASCDAWHDRSIRNTQVFHPIDTQIAIDHRHEVSTHLRGAGLVPVGHDGVADEVFQLRTFQVSWHHFALGEGAQCGGVAYLSAEFHAGYRGLQIVRVRQKICVNVHRVERIGPRQTDTASAFRPYDGTEE